MCPQVESTPVLVEEIVVPVLTPEPEKEPEEEKKEEPAAPEPTPVEPVVRFQKIFLNKLQIKNCRLNKI